jgi:long-subunit acyl-CoA synthetase (AMP-forming)
MVNGGKPIGLYTSCKSGVIKNLLNNFEIDMLVVEDEIQLQKFVDLPLKKIKLILYYSAISKKILDKFDIPIISISSFMSKKKIVQFPKIKLNFEATVIYTSGTTNMPKCISITHENIMTSLKRTIMLIKTKSTIVSLGEEKIISYLPLNHISVQMMDIYFPILTLSSVWFADKDALKCSIKKTIKEVNPTIFVGIPKVWEKIQEQIETEINKAVVPNPVIKTLFSNNVLQKNGLDKCKLALSIMMPISCSTKKYFNDLGMSVNDVYGMSETCGPISISLPGLNNFESVGYPITVIKINKDKEILIKGNNLFKNYYNNKKDTQMSFTKDGWFMSGDLGFLDKNGFLYITGRKSDIIKRKDGSNIIPNIIENNIGENIKKYFEYIILTKNKHDKLLLLLVEPKKIPDNINSIIMTVLNEFNKHTKNNNQTINKYLILYDKFTIGEELTSIMNLKRVFINKKYKNKIDNA